MIGAVVAASALLVTGVGAAAVAGSAPADVLTVDGISLTGDEREAALVRAERQGASASEDAAVELLRDELALFAVARRLGASDVERPADITGLLDEVNADRRSAAARGEVLYGPVEYDQRSFYGKALTDIRQATIDRLDAGAGGSAISDADVRARFDADRSAWAAAATTYDLEVITGTGEIPGESGWESLLGRAAAGATASRTYTARDLESGTVSPETAAELAAAAEGDVIGPFAEAGGWTALRLVSHTVDTEGAFQHYRSRIRATLIDERLDALVAQARSEQDVVLP